MGQTGWCDAGPLFVCHQFHFHPRLFNDCKRVCADSSLNRNTWHSVISREPDASALLPESCRGDKMEVRLGDTGQKRVQFGVQDAFDGL